MKSLVDDCYIRANIRHTQKHRILAMYIKSVMLRPKSGASSKPNATDFYHRPRIYVRPDGETVMENFMEGRHTRPYTLYKQELLPALFRLLGLRDIKVGWSQNAGCSCSCSPGFIVKEGNVPFDIHVTVTDKPVAELIIKGRPQDMLAMRSV